MKIFLHNIYFYKSCDNLSCIVGVMTVFLFYFIFIFILVCALPVYIVTQSSVYFRRLCGHHCNGVSCVTKFFGRTLPQHLSLTIKIVATNFFLYMVVVTVNIQITKQDQTGFLPKGATMMMTLPQEFEHLKNHSLNMHPIELYLIVFLNENYLSPICHVLLRSS